MLDDELRRGLPSGATLGWPLLLEEAESLVAKFGSTIYSSSDLLMADEGYHNGRVVIPFDHFLAPIHSQHAWQPGGVADFFIPPCNAGRMF